MILAEEQTKGRGKPGSSWFSPVGGLYFSIILKPNKEISDLLFITKMTADVIVDLLEKYHLQAEIKLPNDVLVNGKKICGILTEKISKALLIGIGINLNISGFPTGLNATSTLLQTGKKTDLNWFLSEFLDKFYEKYGII